jgi:hypothetical protein
MDATLNVAAHGLLSFLHLPLRVPKIGVALYAVWILPALVVAAVPLLVVFGTIIATTPRAEA